MRKVWIVVANSGVSKIYRAENSQRLVEHGTLFNDEAHLSASDLVSDQMGRETQRFGFGTDTYQPKTSLKQKESDLFAETIALFLKKGCESGECERIYLIASSPFLGTLREALPTQVSKIIQAEVNKDLTQMKPEAIREYLPPVL